MKTAIYSGFAVIILYSCATPSIEENIKSALENQVKLPVTEVQVGDTVLVNSLNARLLVLDSTLLALEQSTKELQNNLEVSIIGLEDAERNLSEASHPALVYGFSESVKGEKRNIESFTSLIDENESITETVKKEREQIENQLLFAGEIIAYVQVSAKIDQLIKEYNLSPDLKIIKMAE